MQFEILWDFSVVCLNSPYYLKCEDDAFDAQNIWASLTDWLNSISGLVFVAAIILTTAFVSINLERATKMSEEKKLSLQGGASVPTMQKITKDAAPAPTMQNIARPDGLEKAAPIPSMQRIPREQAQQQQAPQPQAPQQAPTKDVNKK